MTQKTMVANLLSVRPGAQWAVTGDVNNAQYTDLTWLDQFQTKPSAQDLGF